MPLFSCSLFPSMFPLAPPVEPAALSSSHFPQSRSSWGWGMGSTTALADGFSSSLQCLPRPPTPPRFPSVLSEWDTSRQLARATCSLGAADRLLPTCWYGVIVIPDRRDPVCGCGVLPKATSESRQEKAKISGSFDRKRILIFFLLWMF